MKRGLLTSCSETEEDEEDQYRDWFCDTTIALATAALNGVDIQPQQVPPRIQQCWHDHILDTQNYWTGCLESYSGHYLHCHWSESDASICFAERHDTSCGPDELISQEELRKCKHMSPAEFFALETSHPWMRRTMATAKHIGRDQLLEEYGRLMELLLDPITRPDMVPPRLLDELWHDHILHSRSYFSFCIRTNRGKYLHHVPAAGELSLQPTLRAYKARFGHAPPGLELMSIKSQNL